MPPQSNARATALSRVDRARQLQQRAIDRVEALVLRDAAGRDADHRRAKAHLEIAAGYFVNLADAVDTLPDEQLERGHFATIEVDNPEGTVRQRRRSVRRVARIEALRDRGVLDDEGYACCSWYQQQWETSGMDPLVASRFEPRYDAKTRDFGHLARSERQAAARDRYLQARSDLPAAAVGVFENVVLREMTLDQAARIERCRIGKATALLREGAACIRGYREFRSVLDRRSLAWQLEPRALDGDT